MLMFLSVPLNQNLQINSCQPKTVNSRTMMLRKREKQCPFKIFFQTPLTTRTLFKHSKYTETHKKAKLILLALTSITKCNFHELKDLFRCDISNPETLILGYISQLKISTYQLLSSL